MNESLRAIEEARERNVALEYQDSLRGAENGSEAPLTVFTVQVFGQSPSTHHESAALAVLLRDRFAEVEENLNAGMLPEGFRASVHEWDEEEE